MNDSESFQRAAAAASRLLSHRPRSAAEVRARLGQRFSAQVVDEVVESLLSRGALDDATFAKLWKSSRDALNPRSATVIRRELVAKGISKELAADAVSDADDLDNAYRAGSKASRRLRHTPTAVFRRRLWGYLRRRGFSESITRATVGRLLEERAAPGEEPKAW